MSITNLNGAGLQSIWMPFKLENITSTGAFSGSGLIDATGEKFAVSGYIETGYAQKTINKVHFRFGSVTKSGGSAIKVSLQDVSVAGSIMIPDESIDQFRSIANADAAFTSNGWYTTGLMTSDGTDGGSKRTVNHGDLISVVWEYDGSRTNPDSVVISSMAPAVGNSPNLSIPALKTGGSWAANLGTSPIVLFEFSDGSFGTLLGGLVASAINAHSFKSDTAGADEYALELQMPVPCKLDAVFLPLSFASTAANFDLVVYDNASSALATVSVDAHLQQSTNQRLTTILLASQVSISKNTTYRIAVKPTQATANVQIFSADVSAAGHFSTWPGGTAWYLATRVDGGSWSPTTTRRPLIYPRFSAFDDGVSAGALLTHPGMSGGARG